MSSSSIKCGNFLLNRKKIQNSHAELCFIYAVTISIKLGASKFQLHIRKIVYLNQFMLPNVNKNKIQWWIFCIIIWYMIWYLFTAIRFPPGGNGPYTCTQKAKHSIIHKEKQYRSHNTQNRKQIVRNNKIKIKRIINNLNQLNLFW